MAVLENTRPRRIWIQVLVSVVLLVYIARLFYLQVVDTSYKQLAEDRGLRKETSEPDRGHIYDRNGKLIVYNEPSYKLMVIPAQMKNLDTMRFCRVLGIDRETFIRTMKHIKTARGYSPVHPSVFLSQLSTQEFSSIEEYLYEFKGFYAELSTVRKYPYGTAAHLLGYVSEVDSDDIKRSNGYYELGDPIGKNGVEKSYEDLLRGEKGLRYLIVDRQNREVGSLDNGADDIAPVAGKNLTLSIDIDLQNYAEKLLQNKRGAIVAIEPSTGEILCIVSSPTYDPNLLVGSQRTKNFAMLASDPEKPLNNRALTGYYPPGSTFKPVMAAIGLDKGTLQSTTGYSCGGGYVMSGHTVGCHHHPYPGNLVLGIGYSCNTYFCNVFRHFMDDGHASSADGLADFKTYLSRFGIGVRTGIDLPSERAGNVPDPADYDKIYGKNRWKATNCITLGIGQDQLILTPLQSANSMAVIANRGYYYTPHVLKYAEGEDSLLNTFKIKHETGISDSLFEFIVQGMAASVNFGTSTVARLDNIQVCGKTGTAENPHGKSHSWFACFAPMDNPRIAVAVIVENAGWGASYAAPIASLIVEKYLNGRIADNRKYLEDRMLNTDLIHDNNMPPKPQPKDSTGTRTIVQAGIMPDN